MHEAIIKTLCYSAVFRFPLTAAEIHQRLIGQKASLKQVTRVLKKSAISSHNGYYFITKSHYVHREQVNKVTPQKVADAQKIAGLLKIFPTINAIYITGGVSVGNAAAGDDIDLMIITKPNTLWSTRFFVNLLLDLLGVRRKANQAHVNNKICLNLWLTTQTLAVPKPARSLYTAYEVLQAKPILNRHQTHQAFLYQNRWIKTYLPNTTIPKAGDQLQQTSSPGLIEHCFFRLQQAIMRSKITREKISLNQAFFHPRDTGMIVNQAYQKLLKKHI